MDLGSSQEEAQMGKSGNTSSCNDDESLGICPPSPSPTSSLHVEKEHMFDKVVTPSDVGKLNRLVIPKQHAEKYFPLDAAANEKGLLLNFEDRNGKVWRFRYSYWNSSQSYVMTKGWSRFVKDKKLDAGDIVSFQRGLGEAARERLYIDWRRRPDVPPDPASSSFPYNPHQHLSLHRSVPWNPMLMRPPPPHLTAGYYGGGSVVYLGSAAPQVGIGVLEWQHQNGPRQEPAIVFDSIPVVQGKAAAKRLRLFGVNMDCPMSETEEQDVLESTTIGNAGAVAALSMQCSSHRAPTTQNPNSSSSHHQLRLYNADKGKSSMSLDLDV